ncbi:MAG: hypothetical protein QOH04_519 [Sphingomonadales bacterium]|jgi:hypothetical protein|nr:hypothetical protein [Sphingomonadales bacterium]MEA3034760.1 hypothetical protein [Sphingomonadales bacterium]
MIINETLDRWLGDLSAQRHTRQAMEDAAGALARLPAVGALADGLAAAEREGADAVLALARTLLDDLGVIRACLDLLIAAAARDPFFRPPMRAVSGEVQSGLLLFHKPALSIQLSVMGADRIAEKRFRRGDSAASIFFTGQRSLFRFLDSGGATLSLWEAPEIDAQFIAERSGQCRLVDRRALADGDFFEIDGRRNSFLVEHAPRDLVFVQATTPLGAGPVSAEYDWTTRRLVGTSGTDDAGSRIQLMLTLLRASGRVDAAPLFADLAASGPFHARWHAMRELLGLDAEAALPGLRAMAAGDPHPEVRAAAAETLGALFDDMQERTDPCPA